MQTIMILLTQMFGISLDRCKCLYISANTIYSMLRRGCRRAHIQYICEYNFSQFQIKWLNTIPVHVGTLKHSNVIQNVLLNTMEEDPLRKYYHNGDNFQQEENSLSNKSNIFLDISFLYNSYFTIYTFQYILFD
jgi:hypothetical protein